MLTALENIQESDRKASHLLGGDFNAYHTEWLGSVIPADQFGRATLDFTIRSGCENLGSVLTNISGSCLDLSSLMFYDCFGTDVIPPAETSDHSAYQ